MSLEIADRFAGVATTDGNQQSSHQDYTPPTPLEPKVEGRDLPIHAPADLGETANQINCGTSIVISNPTTQKATANLASHREANSKNPSLLGENFSFSDELLNSSANDLCSTVTADLQDPDSSWSEERRLSDNLERTMEMCSSRFLLNAIARNVKEFQLSLLDPITIKLLKEESAQYSSPSEDLISRIEVSYQNSLAKVVLGGTLDVAGYFKPQTTADMGKTIIRTEEDLWLDIFVDLDPNLDEDKRKKLFERKAGREFSQKEYTQLRDKYQQRVIKEINDLTVPRSTRQYLEEREGRGPEGPPLSNEEIVALIEENQNRALKQEFQGIAEILLAIFRNPENAVLIESLTKLTYDNGNAESLPKLIVPEANQSNISELIRAEFAKERASGRKKTLATIAGTLLLGAFGGLKLLPSSTTETKPTVITKPAETPERDTGSELATKETKPATVDPTPVQVTNPIVVTEPSTPTSFTLANIKDKEILLDDLLKEKNIDKRIELIQKVVSQVAKHLSGNIPVYILATTFDSENYVKPGAFDQLPKHLHIIGDGKKVVIKIDVNKLSDWQNPSSIAYSKSGKPNYSSLAMSLYAAQQRGLMEVYPPGSIGAKRTSEQQTLLDAACVSLIKEFQDLFTEKTITRN